MEKGYPNLEHTIKGASFDLLKTFVENLFFRKRYSRQYILSPCFSIDSNKVSHLHFISISNKNLVIVLYMVEMKYHFSFYLKIHCLKNDIFFNFLRDI